MATLHAAQLVEQHPHPKFSYVLSNFPVVNLLIVFSSSTTSQSHRSPTAIEPTTTTQTLEGKCELFNDKLKGGVCQPYRANRTIYVDARPEYSQSRIADFMSELVKVISIVTDTRSAPPQCEKLLIEGMCIYMMPDCRTDRSGKATKPRLCKENCEHIFIHQHLCHQVLVAASRSSVFLDEVKKFDANFSDFRCDDLPSWQDNGSCYDELLSKYRIPIKINISKRSYLIGSLDFPTLPPPIPQATTNSSAVSPSKAKPQCEAKCAFPFTYQGIEYTECTTVGLQYRNFRPWCMTNAANRQTWVNCNCTSMDGKPRTRLSTSLILLSRYYSSQWHL